MDVNQDVLSKAQKNLIKKGKEAQKRRMKFQDKKDKELIEKGKRFQKRLKENEDNFIKKRKQSSINYQKRLLLKGSTKVQKLKLKLKWAFLKNKSEKELLKKAHDEYMNFKINHPDLKII